MDVNLSGHNLDEAALHFHLTVPEFRHYLQHTQGIYNWNSRNGTIRMLGDLELKIRIVVTQSGILRHRFLLSATTLAALVVLLYSWLQMKARWFTS
ncbi:hypothetical protein Tco_1153284 [Tanacetum coccineum]